MSNTALPHCFLLQTDFSITFARTAAGPSPARVEAIREAPLADPAELAATARTVFGSESSPVMCALRPRPRSFHLATADEAKRHPGLPGVRQFAAAQPEISRFPIGRFAAVQARDGTSPSAAPWSLAFASPTGYGETTALLDAMKLRPVRQVSAAFLEAGALASTATAPAWLLEIGELGTNALLVGSDGILAAGAVSLNLDRISEVVQTELGLKFRGSASKLFFNANYDFSESGPRIAARLAPALKTELAALCANHARPQSVLCTGLPAAQQWFAVQLAAALELPVCSPDPKSMGITFAHPEIAATITPAWTGMLRMIATNADSSSSPWQAEWLPLDAPAAPAPAAPKTVSATQTASAPVTPSAAIPSTQATAPGKKPGTLQAYTPGPARSEPAPSGPASLNRKFIAVAILLAFLLGGGGLYYAHLQKQETGRLAAQQARLKEQLQAEAAKAHLAEQQALAEAEQRKELERESARRLAQAETARRQAETEARTQFAARLANARGGITVATDPAGATVAVGELRPRPAPATFSDVKIGRYPVRITLPQYETANLEVEVNEDTVTDLGVIKLMKLVGTLELATTPASATASYEVKPAGAFVIDPAARRTGRTPVVLHDLAPGDYTVTFTREGWSPHSETVTVVRDDTVQVNWTCPNGTVKITSTPAGAAVTRQGAELGRTPLILRDQQPGDASFILTFEGYAPETVSGRIVGGQQLELATALEPWDHISPMSAVDEKPAVITAVQPELPYDFRQSGSSARVEIELTITREGMPKDAVIKSSTSQALNSLCIDAILQWKFKPATSRGRAVNVRLIVPFNINRTSR